MYPIISQFQTQATSMVGEQWARMVLQNATNNPTLLRNIANAPQAVSPAIGFSEFNLRPFYPYQIIPRYVIKSQSHRVIIRASWRCYKAKKRRKKSGRKEEKDADIYRRQGVRKYRPKFQSRAVYNRGSYAVIYSRETMLTIHPHLVRVSD